MTLKARVHNGRLVVNEPTGLPEGTEMELLPLDPGDWLDPADRAALHQALLASQEDIEAGRLIDAEEVLRELRRS
jgi:predicted outer membrane protein